MGVAERQAEIVAEFAGMTDWKARYRRIIEIGRALPPLPEEFQTENFKVKGCQSQVWLHAKQEEGKVLFAATSDSDIVRGLVALVVKAYSGATPDEVIAQPPSFIDQIGLGESLTQARANGLSAMVKQVKLYAVAFKSLSTPR